MLCEDIDEALDFLKKSLPKDDDMTYYAVGEVPGKSGTFTIEARKKTGEHFSLPRRFQSDEKDQVKAGEEAALKETKERLGETDEEEKKADEKSDEDKEKPAPKKKTSKKKGKK